MDECITDDKNISKSNAQMKPPSTINSMINDHVDHFVTVPYGQKIPKEHNNDDQDDNNNSNNNNNNNDDPDPDDEIRAAMISIMSSQTSLIKNGFRENLKNIVEDNNNDDDDNDNNDDQNNSNNNNDFVDKTNLDKCQQQLQQIQLSNPSTIIFPNQKQTKNINDNYIIIIDDLFVRKFLHQICPKYFDETWLERFKSQYLNSFLLNEDDNDDDNNNFEDDDERIRQKQILDKILSTNQLTNDDEFLVYWKLSEHQHNNLNNNIDFDFNKRNDEIIIPQESWLQHRDPMTYLYNFCELLMFVEMKFDDQKQKDRCQQLAREIRAYLYWISKDERFKEDSIEQEQLTRLASSNTNTNAFSSPQEPIYTNNNDDDAAVVGGNGENVGAEQKLFNSIVQHLLMICYEVMITANILSHHNINPTVITIVEQKERKKFIQIIYQILENLSNKNNVELKSGNTTTTTETLYSQWMKNLNNILIALVEYYELNPMFSIKQNDCNNNNNNNNLPQHQTLDGVNDEDNNVISVGGGGGGVAGLTTKTSTISSVSSTTTIITNNSNNNSSNKIKYFDHPNNNNSNSNNLIVQPSSSSSIMMMDSSTSSTVSNTMPSSVNTIGHHHHHNFHPMASSSPHNNNNNNGGTSSTNVERHNSTTSSSGPSSGVGSLDSSAHHSSSYHRDLFTSSSPSVIGSGGTQKYLPSSASMTPSPANFANATSPLTTATNTTTTEDNNLTMLLQLNQLDDLESLMDNHQQQDQCMPKLIVPQMPPRLLDNNNSDAQTTFGFDFSSLNNQNRPIMIDKQHEFDQNSEFLFCNQTNGVASGNSNEQNGITANGNTNGNGNFFHELNITSLFSSFDDNVSTGAESGTITDGFNTAMVSKNANNATSAAAVGTMAIKHYPDPSEESAIQLPNQCFTMTLDHPAKQFRNSTQHPATSIPKPIVVGSGQQQYGSVCPPLNTPPLIQPTSNGPDHQIASSPIIDDLCERQTLYRLIISQLLFDGHRNIACQVAVAEHIKCDSFLIGPSQELHKLVSFAKNKKKEDILMDKSVDHTQTPMNATPGFGRTNSSGSTYYDSVGNNNNNGIGSPTAQTSPAKMLTSSQTSPYSLRMEDPYSKAIFEHHSNVPVGSHLNFVSNTNNGPQQQLSNTPHTSTSTQNSASILDYGDLNSSATDLYSPSSGQMDYYFPRSPEIHGSMFNKSPTTNPNMNDLQSRQMAVGSQRGGSMKCLQSVESTHSLANVNGNELVLTEACLKNINQLAKLNSSGEATMATGNQNNSTSMNNALLGSGPSPGNGTSNQAVIFGRSASAMAMATTNGSGSVVLNNHPGVIGSNNNLSRSPLTIKSPTGYPATHTTGNGKSHQIMQIVYKFGSLGQLKSQFSSPHGFCLGMNDEIIIADTNNHRICTYDKNGVFKQMFGTPGKDEGQLWYPRKITMIPQNFVRNTLNSPYYVICDRGMERSRMQIFTRNGNFVRKIPIRYIDIVAGIAINSRGHIVVVDSVSPTIYVITIDNGTLIEWRDCGDYMREPSDVAIYDDDYYICDFKGHCVVVIKSNGDFLRKIGMEGLTSFPNGIDISPNGDIFVGDSHGNKFHVVVFNRDGRLLAEYECPYCKVSRCCGLKLTKDNNIVTLAKNNHHVLVLNPNFQQQQQQQLPQLQQQTQQNISVQ